MIFIIIYLDLLLLYNTFINALVLYLSLVFNKLTIKKVRIFITAIIASLISLFAMMYLPLFLQNIVKTILPFIICGIYFSRTSAKQYLKVLFTYILFSIVLSGIMLFTKHSILSENTKIISIISVVISILLLNFAYKTIINLFVKSAEQMKNYHEVIIYHNNTSVSLIGFNDTGNSLVSENYGLPIIIGDEESLKPIIAHNKINYTNSVCYTVLDCGIIKTFQPDSIFIDGKKCSAIVGVSRSLLHADFDILFNLDNIMNNEMEISYV